MGVVGCITVAVHKRIVVMIPSSEQRVSAKRGGAEVTGGQPISKRSRATKWADVTWVKGKTAGWVGIIHLEEDQVGNPMLTVVTDA